MIKTMKNEVIIIGIIKKLFKIQIMALLLFLHLFQ